MAAPTRRTVDQIKKGALKPALTSHYEVIISPPPGDFITYLGKNGVSFNAESQDNLQLACSDAILPGSNLATSEINGDFAGVTERHAHRRVYDDRIDLSFYVQNDGYNIIKFFESWVKYTTNESVAGEDNSITSPYFYYQMKYPKEYYGGLEITKFERDTYIDRLTYKFVNIFPISIASMPISYDIANLLKITISFSYIRYYVSQLGGTLKSPSPSETSKFSSLNPSQLAAINQAAWGGKSVGLNYGEYTTTGGVSFPSSSSSGNAFDVKSNFGGSATLNK